MQEENPDRARLIEEARRHLEDCVLSQAKEQLRAAVEANDRGGRYAVVQRVYEIVTPRILEAEAGRRGWWISPYFLDWDLLFTPIERDAWHSLRARGVRRYPQYPVAGVFLDFGNPALRIGLELDGAAYHDAKQDAARDGRLAKLGWGGSSGRPDAKPSRAGSARPRSRRLPQTRLGPCWPNGPTAPPTASSGRSARCSSGRGSAALALGTGNCPPRR